MSTVLGVAGAVLFAAGLALWAYGTFSPHPGCRGNRHAADWAAPEAAERIAPADALLGCTVLPPTDPPPLVPMRIWQPRISPALIHAELRAFVRKIMEKADA